MHFELVSVCCFTGIFDVMVLFRSYPITLPLILASVYVQPNFAGLCSGNKPDDTHDTRRSVGGCQRETQGYYIDHFVFAVYFHPLLSAFNRYGSVLRYYKDKFPL